MPPALRHHAALPDRRPARGPRCCLAAPDPPAARVTCRARSSPASQPLRPSSKIATPPATLRRPLHTRSTGWPTEPAAGRATHGAPRARRRARGCRPAPEQGARPIGRTSRTGCSSRPTPWREPGQQLEAGPARSGHGHLGPSGFHLPARASRLPATSWQPVNAHSSRRPRGATAVSRRHRSSPAREARPDCRSPGADAARPVASFRRRSPRGQISELRSASPRAPCLRPSSPA